MKIWQADFYRRPLQNEAGEVLWELLICDRDRLFTYEALCPQSQANSKWLIEQLQIAAKNQKPDLIQVFRPQSLNLIQLAAENLGIAVEATRRTFALKQWLTERQYPSNNGEPYNPLAIDKAPPTPLTENLWGEQWRFASLSAGDIVESFKERLIPIKEMPEFLLPLNLGLASTITIPGVVIDGGKKSMQLARWLQSIHPVALNYIAGDPSGLVLEAGLSERWVVNTFTDKEVIAAAVTYTQRQQLTKGLHFLLVQPDNSGMTYSGFWLLGKE
ncbi:Tab2/Atab2 family RNA-binding protein [Synechocystis sp. PCC 7509]|uniref:Tab2/Atab2 family RNA-binding protein n=1 Tax=Synechocystis sp. PCC 7509 TaxID=927677 RepID=UPI0002ABEEF8|nr:Tab2/Atab2 family RNA-binding protein [Synechocystis sp. PCC 7509]